MNLTRYEQETTLNYNERETLAAVEFQIPKRWIKISPPRQISDEQREAMRERAKLAFLPR